MYETKDEAERRAAEIAAIRFRLGHLLTALDLNESLRERVVNIYRLGHYLRAADDFATALHAGRRDAEEAFAETFNPTQGMHKIAKTLGLALGVEHGAWVRKGKEPAK